MSDKRAAEHDPALEIIEHPSNFALVYESKDGRLCLFEDAEGHLTVVRAERLV